MNDLQKELQALKAKVADLESRIAAEPVKWKPKGGCYYVTMDGEIDEDGVDEDDEDVGVSFGVRRKTQAQAQRASIEMRRFNRLLALRDELCGDDVPTLESSNISKYFIVYNGFENTWDVSAMYKGFITPCFKTEQQARRACDMLNSGEVEL